MIASMTGVRAAYNAGTERVRRAQTRTGERDFWAISSSYRPRRATTCRSCSPPPPWRSDRALWLSTAEPDEVIERG